MPEYKPFLMLQRQVLESTIWHQPCFVRVAWVGILIVGSEPGRRGVIDIPIKSLASRINLTEQETTDAIKILCSPDPESRTPDKQGRRMELLDPEHRDWGWKIINWEKNEETRRAALHSERQARYRVKVKCDAHVTPRDTELPVRGGGSGSGSGKEIHKKPTQYSELFEEFWKAYPARKGLKKGKPEAFRVWQGVPGERHGTAIKAAKNYSACDDVKRGFAKDACRFLRDEDLDDWALGVASKKALTLQERFALCDAEKSKRQHQNQENNDGTF